ncbi:MAG: DNA polymerase I [Clostridia bacterium]|nr:DNA polymerase I [Clostridia bacterium]
MKRLLVVDGNSIINRAYYGVRPLSTSRGEPTGAIFGAVHMLKRQLEAIRPDYAAVAFDLHAPTFRHKLYPEYKAGRRPTPPDLLAQFDPCKECFSALGLHLLSLEGYEADDILGTLSRLGDESGEIETYVFSGDRDLLQLISPTTTVLLAGNGETLPYGADAFRARFGIEVGQYLDLKALMGDSSDNIPGVPGIGEKGAVKLLSAYGDLDGVFAHKDELSPALTKKLTEGEALGRLSRRLAEIERNVPIEMTLDNIAYTGADEAALYRVFAKFELSSLIREFRLSPPAEPIAEPSPSSISLPALREASLDELSALDLSRIALALTDGGVLLSDGKSTLLCREALSRILPYLTREGQYLVCYDAKPIFHALYGAGVENPPVLHDLMLYSYLLRAGDGAPETPENLLRNQLSLTADPEHPEIGAYLALEELLLSRLEETGQKSLLLDLELPLVPVLAKMERVGFRVDLAGLSALGQELGERAAEIERKIYDLAGHPFSILSPKQLGEVLFAELGLKGGKKTKSGYSTAADVLEGLRSEHPIVPLVLTYRQLTKLRSTYAVALAEAADEGGRIHTDFRQALTATGRLSSSEPNLQNIPVRTELGRLFRALFVAGEGRVLVDADYSQIELRLLAHISGDEAMLSAFSSGVDIHTMTAASVFRLPYEMVSPELRSAAKAVNFGIMYGIGPHSLSLDLGIPHAEAKRYIEDYLASYPKIAAYLDSVTQKAAQDGYTTTLFGRRRRIPELLSTNKMTQSFGRRIAMNSPIQGSSADIMKRAMIAVDRRLKDEAPTARLVMQVHDELIVEADERDAELISRILVEEMQGAASLSLPLLVEAGVGKTWDAAK